MSAPETSSPDKQPRGVLRGCAYTMAGAVLAFGILYTGHFSIEAWASALAAIIIGVLVVRLSGINGSWE